MSLFFKKGWKVKYISHLSNYHHNFFSDLPMVFIYKFFFNLIQPPGKPREQNLGEVQQKSLSYTKFHIRQKDRKSWYSLSYFWEKCKKVKIEVTGWKKTFSSSFFFLLSHKAWKVKYLRHFLTNYPNYLVNLPMVFSYKFW